MKKHTAKRQKQQAYSKGQEFGASKPDIQQSQAIWMLTAAFNRFLNTYPSTSVEDWKTLLETEALLGWMHEQGKEGSESFNKGVSELDKRLRQKGMPGVHSTGLPSGNVDRLHQTLCAAVEFVDAFTLVFEHDWDETKNWIADADDCGWLEDGETFANPDLDDERSIRVNHAILISAYRQLLNLLNGLEDARYLPDQSFFNKGG